MEFKNFIKKTKGRKREYKADILTAGIPYEIEITEWYMGTGTKKKVKVRPSSELGFKAKIKAIIKKPLLSSEEWYNLYFVHNNSQPMDYRVKKKS